MNDKNNEPHTTRTPATGASIEDGAAPPHPVISQYYGSSEKRQEWVDHMFDASAAHYDWITDVMSFGSGRWYRNWALRRHGLDTGMKLLDVGTGTGVLAQLGQEQVGPEGEVVAVDPSEGMLDQARAAGVKDTRSGHGEDLPVDSDHFDLLTMGYALRHVADLNATFREYRRALAPGGRVLLLEITPPRSRIGYVLLRFYLRTVVPLVTRVFRRSRDAQVLMYYYWDTIEKCVPPETILDALRTSGFEQGHRHVIFGIFSEYSGVKPAADDAGAESRG